MSRLGTLRRRSPWGQRSALQPAGSRVLATHPPARAPRYGQRCFVNVKFTRLPVQSPLRRLGTRTFVVRRARWYGLQRPEPLWLSARLAKRGTTNCYMPHRLPQAGARDQDRTNGSARDQSQGKGDSIARRSAGLCAAAASEFVTHCDRLGRQDLRAVASPLAPATARLAYWLDPRVHGRRPGRAPHRGRFGRQVCELLCMTTCLVDRKEQAS